MPATLTAICATYKGKDRFSITLDNQPFAVLSTEAVYRLKLREGDILNDEAIALIQEEAGFVHTWDRSLAILARRSHSTQELKRKLLRKGESEPVIEKVLARLVHQGLLNDADFARQYARSRATNSGHAKMRITHDLMRRGVPRPIAEHAVREIFAHNEGDAQTALQRLAQKKLRTLASEDSKTQRRRLYGFLARRGFGPEEILAAMEQAFRACP